MQNSYSVQLQITFAKDINAVHYLNYYTTTCMHIRSFDSLQTIARAPPELVTASTPRQRTKAQSLTADQLPLAPFAIRAQATRSGWKG